MKGMVHSDEQSSKSVVIPKSYVVGDTETSDVSRYGLSQGRFSLNTALEWRRRYHALCCDQEKTYTFTGEKFTKDMKS